MKSKILLVDDESNILSAYQRNLRSRYEIVTADSGPNGLNIFKEQGPFAVVVSDYRMPLMDGIEFLAQVKLIDQNSTRIMLTGQADMQTAIKAVNEGNIFRFLTKPCPHDFLINILEAAVEQYDLIMSEKVLLEKTLRGSIKVLIDLLTILNPLAFSQSARLRTWARKIAFRLKISKIWEVEIAALLSQIGCVTIPPEIMAKIYNNDKLPEQEKKIYLKHPSLAKDLINNIPRLDTVAEGIMYQLKNYDGSGFPDDPKKGEDIPFIGRILRIILEYDNIIQNNVKPKEALEIIRKNIKCFDPVFFEALEAEVLLVAQGYLIKSISLRELMPGMVLAEDIKNETGVMLVAKGIEMTEALYVRLQNYASMSLVVEPIKVLEVIKK